MKLVHLVGFITKKFVTMHGHMNVKSYRYFTLLSVYVRLEIVISNIGRFINTALKTGR